MTDANEYYDALCGQIACGHVGTLEELEKIATLRQGKTIEGLTEDLRVIRETHDGSQDILKRYTDAIRESVKIDTTQSLDLYYTRLKTIGNFHHFLKILCSVHRDL